MLNRYLSLVVSVVAPASAATMLIAGAHTIGTVTLGERVPCAGLALVAALLAVSFLRTTTSTPSTRAEAAMWSGLGLFFVVAACVSPHLGAWAVVATLALAAASALRLLAGSAPRAVVVETPIRRRLFA